MLWQINSIWLNLWPDWSYTNSKSKKLTQLRKTLLLLCQNAKNKEAVKIIFKKLWKKNSAVSTTSAHIHFLTLTWDVSWALPTTQESGREEIPSLSVSRSLYFYPDVFPSLPIYKRFNNHKNIALSNATFAPSVLLHLLNYEGYDPLSLYWFLNSLGDWKIVINLQGDHHKPGCSYVHVHRDMNNQMFLLTLI